MNIFQKLWNSIDAYFSYDELSKIKQLTLSNKELTKAADELMLERETLQKDRDELVVEVAELQEKVDELTEEEVTKPKFLSSNITYKPRRRFVSDKVDKHFFFEKFQHVFDKSVYLSEKLEAAGLIDVGKSWANLVKVHQFVHKNTPKYGSDRVDNWRPVTESMLGEEVDCEDYAIVLCSALGMAGWGSDEVFVAVGWYTGGSSKFYHAWCVAFLNGAPYVLEGTNKAEKPRQLFDVKHKYSVDGMGNWKFAGNTSNNKLLKLEEVET